jgi:fructokinase
MPASEILCVGEVLWDALPAGLFLGGAPFNVACHLRALGVPVGLVSRVGADRLGREAIRRVGRYGIGTELIQIDPELPTGFVCVTLDAQGNAGYDIVAPTAWDAIEPTDAVLRRAAAARAIVFGSLAQRAVTTRDTIERLWETGARKVFDVNLRAPYHSPEIVERSLRRSNVVKLNHDELRQLASWFGLPDAPRAAAAALAARFGCEIVCVTRGGGGAALWRDDRWTEHPGFRIEVADTVGAGDAFLAALLAALLDGKDDLAALRQANLIGAYVATRLGAVPEYDGEAMARIVEATREADRDAVPRPPSTAGGPLEARA